jgi:hypothetical protein
MTKLNSGHDPHSIPATRADVREILGDVDDGTATAILDLRPTISDVEAASFWAAGKLELLHGQQPAPEGVIAQIFDILTASEGEPEPTIH